MPDFPIVVVRAGEDEQPVDQDGGGSVRKSFLLPAVNTIAAGGENLPEGDLFPCCISSGRT